jgi:ATP-dependent DNA helicase RecQ
VVGLEAQSGVRRGKLELILKQLAVEEVTERVDNGWIATGKDWVYDAEHYDGVIATRRREAAIMRDYNTGASCLMELLQASLDDPHAEPCGRCSVCRGGLQPPLSPAPRHETVAAVARTLRGEVHVLEPRKMWPGGAFGTRGRISPDDAAEEGRTLIWADAPEWREVAASMRLHDGEAPEEVLDACVRVLAEWRASWPARPEVVVDLAGSGPPRFTASVADHLASVGRLDRASPTVKRPPDDLRDRGSGEEAAWWRDAIDVSAITEAVAGRSVLLVVGASATLWPITVGAAALRRAGASLVLPLLIHRQP